jgi:hypothetical protein
LNSPSKSDGSGSRTERAALWHFPGAAFVAATGAFGAWYFESDSTTPVIPTVTTSTQKQIDKPAARVAGIYEITRTSRVYAEPSEFSPQLIGNIEVGDESQRSSTAVTAG